MLLSYECGSTSWGLEIHENATRYTKNDTYCTFLLFKISFGAILGLSFYLFFHAHEVLWFVTDNIYYFCCFSSLPMDYWIYERIHFGGGSCWSNCWCKSLILLFFYLVHTSFFCFYLFLCSLSQYRSNWLNTAFLLPRRVIFTSVPQQKVIFQAGSA